MQADAEGAIEGIQRQVAETFQDVRRILSFPQYLELVAREPHRLLRNASQYLVDMLEWFGRERVERFGAETDRFKLFDGAFPGGRDFLSGQEQVQNEIYRILKGLAEEARTDKLILLHGPNGSSKTTLVNLIFRGLEHYSHTEEGVLYRFAWIFPKSQARDRHLGFASQPRAESDREAKSLAFLDPEDIAARIPCELKDAPIFLVPREERLAFFKSIFKERDGEALALEKMIPSCYLEGDLDAKSKAIYEGLLTGYQGDWKRVIRHVQVERYFLSRRFRTGAVSIDPQMHVDAAGRQVTADRSLDYLPAMLQNVRLVEPTGDLVDANHGVIEYSDFLKRPIDMNKYLLSTVETGNVSLPGLFLHLDLVFLATTNENHLDAFKKTLDYNSFKARMELVQVPYLLRCSDEEAIYADTLRAIARRKPVLPHTGRVAALWAVLTRLNKPNRKRYSDATGKLVDRLTPLEKAKLYDDGTTPAWMKDDEKKRIRRVVPEMQQEFSDEVLYEGRFGASPREIRAILNEASHLSEFPCLSPLSVFRVLQDFIKEKNVYDFLNLEPEGKFHDHAALIECVRDEYHTWVTAEIEEAMELIESAEYDRKCDEYFRHVIAFSRGEKLVNPSTGAREPPSDAVMGAVESLLDIQEPIDTFRRNLVTRIGAFRIDHPEAPVVYKELFADIFAALRQDFFARRREQVEQIEEQLLRYDAGDATSVLPRVKDRVERTIRNLRERHGYPEAGLKEVILFVRKHRKLDA